jgi:hypothetical protein
MTGASEQGPRGLQGEFLAVLGKMDYYLVRGIPDQASRQWRHLEALVERAGNPEAGVPQRDQDQMRAILTTQAARLEQARTARAALQVRSATRRRRSGNAVCTLCGDPFWRKEGERRQMCLVCRPAGSTSIRTVSGGLPTLGKDT